MNRDPEWLAFVESATASPTPTRANARTLWANRTVFLASAPFTSDRGYRVRSAHHRRVAKVAQQPIGAQMGTAVGVSAWDGSRVDDSRIVCAPPLRMLVRRRGHAIAAAHLTLPSILAVGCDMKAISHQSSEPRQFKSTSLESIFLHVVKSRLPFATRCPDPS